jgi:hypothetical protein
VCGLVVSAAAQSSKEIWFTLISPKSGRQIGEPAWAVVAQLAAYRPGCVLPHLRCPLPNAIMILDSRSEEVIMIRSQELISVNE